MSVFVACTTVATAYALSSYIFLRNPQWIHRKRQIPFVVRNIAHRGGAGESIENSLLAFDQGLKNGVEMLELDCHITKDHQTVVHHDFSLHRMTGDIRFIRDIEYNKLPSLKNNVELYYNSNTIISSDNNLESRDLLRIPLLKDVFERYPTIPINIDIKENNDELIKQVADLIQQYRREDITIWGSFSHKICRKLTAQNPDIIRFCSFKEVFNIVLSYWVGLLPFMPLTSCAFEVPFPGEVFRKSRTLDWKFKLFLYLVERAVNNKSMFAHLQQRGIPVYSWILNDEEEIEYVFKKLGVTGVMTDYPKILQKYLNSNKHEFIL